MRQRGYTTLGFLLVILAAASGIYLVRTVVGPIEPPDVAFVARLSSALAEIDVNALLPLPRSTGRGEPPATPEPTIAAPARTGLASPTPEAEAERAAGLVETPEAAATATPQPPLPSTRTPERPTPTPAPPTPTPTPPPDQGYAFLPLGDLRHTSGDCPGPSIRGVVRDLAGNPLAGVRLWRYDQWGNEQTVESKSGQADLGHYDFPLGDTPNVHYVQVVDGSGAPISPSVQVPHRQGDFADATCHWVDWVRR